MPKNKDLKRLVRARMHKTGEAYTTARGHVLAQKPRRAQGNGAGAAAPAAVDLAAIAGHRDAVIEAKTGRTWAQWTSLLDKSGAQSMRHTDIAAMLVDQHDIPGWWAQAVTVGYERIRGRRVRNQTTRGFEISKSRTFAVPVAKLRAAFQPRARKQWLGDDAVAERKATSTMARWNCADGSRVDVAIGGKGPGKSVATVQHSRLASRADVDRTKALWTGCFAALAEWLERHG